MVDDRLEWFCITCGIWGITEDTTHPAITDDPCKLITNRKYLEMWDEQNSVSNKGAYEFGVWAFQHFDMDKAIYALQELENGNN